MARRQTRTSDDVAHSRRSGIKAAIRWHTQACAPLAATVADRRPRTGCRGHDREFLRRIGGRSDGSNVTSGMAADLRCNLDNNS